MSRISKTLLITIVAFVFCRNHVFSQDAAAVDSMKKELAAATSVQDKVYWLDLISRTTMNVNLQDAENYGKQLILTAEESRDRKLMVDAYTSNGLRCSYFAGQKDYTKRAIDYYTQALEIATQNKMDESIAGLELRLSSIHLAIPDKDKAFNYVNHAFSLISTLRNDSLTAEAHNAYGNVYLASNEKTLALRYYLNALRIAEEIKNEQSRNELVRDCYLHLSAFYSAIEDYDRAIDYRTLAYQKLDVIDKKNVPYMRAMDINSIGNLFSRKKNYDIAIKYYERSIAMADSLKFSTLKIPGYISLLNQYLRLNQPQKALDYMHSPEGAALQKFLTDFGFPGTIDQAYAVIYTGMNQIDSARYYFNRAAPSFEQTSRANKINFYTQLASFYKKAGENNNAIEYYLKVKEMSDKDGELESSLQAAKELDSLYLKTNNYTMASLYNGIYYTYRDSIDKLNKQKELAQVEASDEQYRQKKADEEKAEKQRRKNNIQYLAITIGIAGMFVLLVLFGMFKVSASTIKLIGFFAFLLFFEFIFLLFKKNIYILTHGEPWKDLAFMIALAALLVPLHHWLEHRVIKYLTSHNRLTASGKSLVSKVFTRRKEEDDRSKM